MGFEFEILHALQGIHNEVLNTIMMFITTLGDGGIIWILSALSLIFIPAFKNETREHLRERRIAGIMIIISLLLTLLCVNGIMKTLIQRERPFQVDTSLIPLTYPIDSSFPSGHTASSFTAAMAIFLFKKKLGVPAFALAILIAFSRMYIGVHFPTDVLVGAAAGVICAIVIKKYAKPWLEKKFTKL